MRLLLAFLAAVLWGSSAAASDLSAEVGGVSDYRFRGISLSGGHAAVQGSVTIEHGSGIYAQLWGSTLGHGADTEVDLTAGYDAQLLDELDIDLSGTWYAYPTGSDGSYFETTAVTTYSLGAGSAKLGMSYVPPQGSTRSNTYVFTEASYAVPKSPLSLTVSFGYERGAFDEVERGGKWDWSAGGEVALKPARLRLTYVGSNADAGDAIVAAGFVNF